MEIPTLESKTESLIVPFASVLHDIHGGQWVYEQIAVHTYTRRRVQVARLAGAEAVLGSGPSGAPATSEQPCGELAAVLADLGVLTKRGEEVDVFLPGVVIRLHQIEQRVELG